MHAVANMKATWRGEAVHSPLFEIAGVIVRCDQGAHFIENANLSMM
jgi:hypothetical protein